MQNILETSITKFCKLVKDINNKNEVMECKQSIFTNSSDFLELNSIEVSEFMQKQEELRDLLNEITKRNWLLFHLTNLSLGLMQVS